MYHVPPEPPNQQAPEAQLRDVLVIVLIGFLVMIGLVRAVLMIGAPRDSLSIAVLAVALLSMPLLGPRYRAYRRTGNRRAWWIVGALALLNALLIYLTFVRTGLVG